jgi:hypothetical protein
MFITDLAFTGLRLALGAGQLAPAGIRSSTGTSNAPRVDATPTAALERWVTRDLPETIGYAVGSAVDATVQSVEFAREAWAGAVDAALAYAGVPEPADLTALRRRVDELSARLERLNVPVARSRGAS